MSVKKIKISLPEITGSAGASISIPLRLDATPTDNTDLIDNEFVFVERRKTINPIIDYEKVRVAPYILKDGTIYEVDKIIFNVFFSTGAIWESTYGSNHLESGAFTDDDLKYRFNRFKNSFLRLRYHSAPNNTAGELVGLQQIYTQLGDDNVYIYKDPPTTNTNETNIKAKVGKPLPANINPVRLVVGNNRKIKGVEPDGFFFYWQKRHFPQVIYLSYTFNNAKNGDVTTLTPKNLTTGSNITFSQIHELTFIPIEMKEDNGVNKYIFKPPASHDGISYDITTKILTINLYEKVSNI